jgi:hypothetical protein
MKCCEYGHGPLTFPANVRLVFKKLSGTNTPTYFAAEKEEKK